MAERIRDARAGDRDVIREVTPAAYREYATQMPALWEDYRANILATLADIAPTEQIVAEQVGAVVGAVLLYPAGAALPGAEGGRGRRPWPEVRLLAVAPSGRGQGRGRPRARPPGDPDTDDPRLSPGSRMIETRRETPYHTNANDEPFTCRLRRDRWPGRSARTS
jgi:GNAT superfamily N-acetyltransferase